MLSTIRMVKYNPTLLIEATGKRVVSILFMKPRPNKNTVHQKARVNCPLEVKRNSRASKAVRERSLN